MGFAQGDFIQHNYHWRDVLTHIQGAHTLKFGYEGRRAMIWLCSRPFTVNQISASTTYWSLAEDSRIPSRTWRTTS